MTKKEKYTLKYAPHLLFNVIHYLIDQIGREGEFKFAQKKEFGIIKRAAEDFEKRFRIQIATLKDNEFEQIHQKGLDDFREHSKQSTDLMRLYIRKKLSDAGHGNVDILSLISLLDVLIQLARIYAYAGYKYVDMNFQKIEKHNDILKHLIDGTDEVVVDLDDETFRLHTKAIENKIISFDYSVFY